jgi:hypothetical protein
MIRISHTITETKDGNRSTWETIKKVYIFGILVYSLGRVEKEFNEKKNRIGFQAVETSFLDVPDENSI